MKPKPEISLFVALCAGAAALVAQNAGGLTIRGVVVEDGSGIPIPGVDIFLSGGQEKGSRLLARTNGVGEFEIPVAQPGTYEVQATKTGYRWMPFDEGGVQSRASIKLDVQNRSANLRLGLIHPGELTGRVIDDATGDPVEGFEVVLVTLQHRGGRLRFGQAQGARTAKSDSEGRFLVQNLIPGTYLATTAETFIYPDAKAGEAEIDIKEEVHERLFWPGGTSAERALPAVVPPGSLADVGTMRLRKVPAFRALVSISNENCDPGETFMTGTVWVDSVGVEGLLGDLVSCGGTFLYRGLTFDVERWVFAISSSETGSPERMRWGLARLNSDGGNVRIPLELKPGAEIRGRFVVPVGLELPPLSAVHVITASTGIPGIRLPGGESSAIAPNGAFRLLTPATQVDLEVRGLPNSHYVKAIRWNGVHIEGPRLALPEVSTAHDLEIELDDRPASVSGVVLARGQPVANAVVTLSTWPTENVFLTSKRVTASPDGRFTFDGLPPGDYRLAAVESTQRAKLEELFVPMQLLESGTTQTVTRGEHKSISLELAAPR